MELKQIEKLMEAMCNAQLSRVAIKKEGFEIELERESFSAGSVAAATQPVVVHAPQPQALQTLPMETKPMPPGTFVTSPMVGTFYSAPSPEDPPFVKVGETVDEETVVCIIEAMKVMNEVKAGVKGVISEILVKNGDPLEFGSRIFQVNPA